jgi:uncharacterized protein (UPF0332 family)
MTDGVQELLDKSEQSINAAGLLLRDGYDDFAASRAYYAMFYAVEALMLDCPPDAGEIPQTAQRRRHQDR